MLRSHLFPLNCLLLSVLALGLVQCSTHAEEDPILATVGEELIGLEDFKRAYLPVLLYSDKREGPETREEILNFLIDQSILAQEARNLDLDTIPTLDVLRRTAEKAAFTRIMYREQVRKNMGQISDKRLREAYRRSHTKRLVSHLFMKDSAEAFAHALALEEGASWDSLAVEVFDDPGLAAQGGILGWMTLGDMDPDFEEAAFALPVNEVSAPVRTRFGWHIIRVLEESRELMLTEYDYQLERSRLEQTLRQQREQRLADSVINDYMGNADLVFSPDMAPEVWRILNLQLLQIQEDEALEALNPQELNQFQEQLDPLLNEEMLSFRDQQWTVADFLERLPEMNRQLMLTNIKQATAYLVRDELIYQDGFEQELHLREDVQAEVRDRENQFLSNLYLRYRASGHMLSEKTVETFYEQYASNRYLAPDSIFIRAYRAENPSSLEFLGQLTLPEKATTDALKGLPLESMDLGWFRGVRADHASYYHRLVNLPLGRIVGPLSGENDHLFIAATERRRHPKPLDTIRETVEQDAFDQWVARLRHEELKKLRGNYPVTIDRELLHNFEI